MNSSTTFDRRAFEVSTPSRILFPDEGITKQDLVDYYGRVAGLILPRLEDRPLTLQRFPDGIEQEGFFQKQAPDFLPDWIRRVEVDKEEGVLRQIVCDHRETLQYLAGLASVTFHIWLSRSEQPRHPDRLIFDVDPPADQGVEAVRRAVRTVRSVLEELGLQPFLMTTGSSGYHLLVPLIRHHDFETVGDFARRTAALAAAREPDDLTVEIRKRSRRGRIFIDWMRNHYAQTSVAPYSVRALPGAPVAVPIDWDELGHAQPQSYNLGNIFRRLGQKEDPWIKLNESKQDLRPALRSLSALED